jgi:hypothetical protein
MVKIFASSTRVGKKKQFFFDCRHVFTAVLNKLLITVPISYRHRNKRKVKLFNSIMEPAEMIT